MNRIALSAIGRQGSRMIARSAIPYLSMGTNTGSLLPLQVLTSTNLTVVRSLGAVTKPAAVIPILQRELDEEMATESTKMPPELAELKAKVEKDWRIVEDGAVVKLHRTLPHNNAKVQLVFHCQDSMPDDDYMNDYNDEEEEEEDQEGNQRNDEEEEDDSEWATPLRFQVQVAKGGKTLVLSCLTTEAQEPSISSVTVTTKELKSHDDLGVDDYQGPVFEELAEDLQLGFLNLLRKEVRVTPDVITFLTMYSDFKEQSQYVQFLQDAKNVLS